MKIFYPNITVNTSKTKKPGLLRKHVSATKVFKNCKTTREAKTIKMVKGRKTVKTVKGRKTIKAPVSLCDN